MSGMRIGKSPHTPAPESRTVQRARAKAMQEITNEKKQLTSENIQEALKTIHAQQSRNPKHQKVSAERFSKYTGQTPQAVLDIFSNK